MDDEWDRARADRSVVEIERLELERLENVKAAMREAKAFARDFVAADKRLIRQIRRLTGYLDAHGILTHDPDEIAVEDLLSPWEDAVDTADPLNDAKELLREVEAAEREYEEEQEEENQQHAVNEASRNRFPQRELSGDTIEDTARAAIGMNDEFGSGAIHDTVEPEQIVQSWENAVSSQFGRTIRFRRWREYTSNGHWRYVSVNREVGAVAVIEQRTYNSIFVANRAMWALGAQR